MDKTSRIATMFLWSAIAQGAILAATTFVIFIWGSVYLSPSPSMVIASGSAGIWLAVGYVMYVVMVLALGVTSFLYDYIEARLGRRLDNASSALARVHLVLMNLGILGASLLLIYAGYVGGVGLMPASVGGGGLSQLQVHEQILGQFPVPIIAFVAATIIGVLAGGLAYIRSLLRRR
ncbi:MAG: hypothetical protein KGH54_03610 [Candidatus Micrarchaeota archaeon]|nr:hypothetical protein [Candidatus Micrarchaeota archaeon]